MAGKYSFLFFNGLGPRSCGRSWAFARVAAKSRPALSRGPACPAWALRKPSLAWRLPSLPPSSFELYHCPLGRPSRAEGTPSPAFGPEAAWAGLLAPGGLAWRYPYFDLSARLFPIILLLFFPLFKVLLFPNANVFVLIFPLCHD